MPTEEDKAYLAGLIDGEGTIYIGLDRSRRRNWAAREAAREKLHLLVREK